MNVGIGAQENGSRQKTINALSDLNLTSGAKAPSHTRTRIAGIALAVVFAASLLLGLFSLAAAYDKKDRYYNSEDYSSLNENAYVGGDAYNYIINGTHFTGYMVQGMGFLVISTLAGVGALYFLCKKEPDLKIEKTEELPAI